MLSSQKQKKALLVKPGKLENRTDKPNAVRIKRKPNGHFRQIALCRRFPDKPNVLRLLKPNGIFKTGRKTAAQT
jgi:hypothetical protein